MAIDATSLDELASAPQTMAGDGATVTERSADDILKLAGASTAESALDGSNPQGGRKSAWRLTRKAIFSPGGGS